MPNDVCEVFCYDEEKVKRVRKTVDRVEGVEMMFKALADQTRLKVAYALLQEEELCVCDIANIIGTSTANASHHLRTLRNMGLAKYRKEGKLVFYALKDEHIRTLIETALIHHEEREQLVGKEG